MVQGNEVTYIYLFLETEYFEHKIIFFFFFRLQLLYIIL